MKSLFRRDKLLAASALLTMLVPVNGAFEDDIFLGNDGQRRHRLVLHLGKSGGEATDKKYSDPESMHPSRTVEKRIVANELDYIHRVAEEPTEEDNQRRRLIHISKIFRIMKSQSYHGDLNPRGTVVIRAGDDSSVVYMSVKGADPMCGNDIVADFTQTAGISLSRPSKSPTKDPSDMPTYYPTYFPSYIPTGSPSYNPSRTPTRKPTHKPNPTASGKPTKSTTHLKITTKSSGQPSPSMSKLSPATSTRLKSHPTPAKPTPPPKVSPTFASLGNLSATKASTPTANETHVSLRNATALPKRFKSKTSKTSKSSYEACLPGCSYSCEPTTLMRTPPTDNSCLCGYCMDCNSLPLDEQSYHCNGSCMFVKGAPKPYVLFFELNTTSSLALGVHDHVTISFESHKDQAGCNDVASKNLTNGLYRVGKPIECQDESGVGVKVSGDYNGDGLIDFIFDTSCSNEIYLGMAIENSPFILEGYCSDHDNDESGRSCSHIRSEVGVNSCQTQTAFEPTFIPLGTATPPPTSSNPSNSPTKKQNGMNTYHPPHSPSNVPARMEALGSLMRVNVTTTLGNSSSTKASKAKASKTSGTDCSCICSFKPDLNATPSALSTSSMPKSLPTSQPSTFLPTSSKPTSTPSSKLTTSTSFAPLSAPISKPPTTIPISRPSSTPTSTPPSDPTTLKPSSTPTSKPTTSLPTSDSFTQSTTSRPSISPTFKPTTYMPSHLPTGKPSTVLPTSSNPPSIPTFEPTSSTPSSLSTIPLEKLPTSPNLSSITPYQPTSSKPSSPLTTEPTMSRPASSKPTNRPDTIITSTPTFTLSFEPTTLKPSSTLTSKPTTSIPTSDSLSHSTTSKPSISPTSKPTTYMLSHLPTGEPSTVLPTSSNPPSIPTFEPTSSTPSSLQTIQHLDELPTSPNPSLITPYQPTSSKPSSPLTTEPSTSRPASSRPTNHPDAIINLDCVADGPFDPTSNMTSYNAAGCGPQLRGEYRAHFDTSVRTGPCPFGWRVVSDVIPGQSDFATVVCGCQYWSYKVYECLPQVIVERSRCDARFDPQSPLCGYISDECGPRGNVAMADLSQCKFGHEKVLWVPRQGENIIDEISGCKYFSLEVFMCLPEVVDNVEAQDSSLDITQSGAGGSPLSRTLSSAGDVDDLESQSIAGDGNITHLGSKSCAVVVTTGSCSRPGIDGFVLGTTDETEYTVGKLSFLENGELDGKVVLIHDHGGDVIGCGSVDEEQEPTLCLCGSCRDCSIYDSLTCNKEDSCRFDGNENAKPISLYLKLQVPDEYLTQINVHFMDCVATMDKDGDGLFHISKPEYCEGVGLGPEIYIDYKGDNNPDFVVNTSCSEPLFAGMKVQDSPFVVEGYCMSDVIDSCTHITGKSDRICVGRV